MTPGSRGLRGHGFRARGGLTRRALVACVLACIGIVFALLSLSTGDVDVPIPAVVRAVLGLDTGAGSFVVTELRAPRVIGAIIVGVGLGAAGAITQSLLRNPLASPDIIGVTAGASTAAVLALASSSALLSVQSWIAGLPVPLAALAGGLIAGSLVLALAWRRGLAPHRVVLVGLGVNAGFGAATSWVLLHADLPGLASSLTWLTGSLNQVRTEIFASVALIIAIILVLLVLLGRTLALLRYDVRIAGGLGIHVQRGQLMLLIAAIGLAAVVTAVAGPVPFVAFAAPQIAFAAMRTEGPPVAGGALVGAVMMLTADFAAVRLFSSALPVGVITSFIGIPVLLWLLLRTHRRVGS